MRRLNKLFQLKLFVRPIHLKEANNFVQLYHRHSIPTVGGKFAIACFGYGPLIYIKSRSHLVGVAIAGRPVARNADDGVTLEILRVCGDGTPNVNSFLYSRVKRIGQLMGYEKFITYTLQEESGVSLSAIKAKAVSNIAAGEWDRSLRPRRSQEVYKKSKIRWSI